MITYFIVCGEGVERARDEIKRMDESVAAYLKAYDEHIANGALVLKVCNVTHIVCVVLLFANNKLKHNT